MNLREQLNMLANGSVEESEKDLLGIEPQTDNSDNNESDEVLFSSDSLSIDSYLKSSGYKKGKKKSKKNTEHDTDTLSVFSEPLSRKKSSLEKLSAAADKMVKTSSFEDAETLDAFLDDDEGFFTTDENRELKNGLISLGRKYARENASTKESSEVAKSFADSEKKLKALYEELDRDKDQMQKDIDKMRVPGRGGKTLTDMVSAKISAHQAQLSIVKELNAMRKSIFEIQTKEATRKANEEAGAGNLDSNTIQNLFSSARGPMIQGVGGYGEVSGAQDETPISSPAFGLVDDDMDDDEIERRYFTNDEPPQPTTQDSGDKFIEYEGRGVEYVVVLDESNRPVEMYAEDKDGYRIDDFPMPSNISELHFEVDDNAGTATDDLHRNYRIKREVE